MADYHIMTDYSTFGNGAAAVGLKWRSLVRLDLELQGPWVGCPQLLQQYPFTFL